MAERFDRIVVVVPDLLSAIDQYQQLLGAPPFNCESPSPVPAAWWDLHNTVIELVQGQVAQPRLQGLVFSSPGAEPGEKRVANALGIDIRTCDGALTADFRASRKEAQVSDLSVDHVVLRTDDAQACIDLFAGELELRLALDKTVPQWGGRMLFFRAGKLTLEVIESDRDRTGGTQFWGLAYQCQDLARHVQVLEGRGVSVSAVRDGRKPGTRVATIKSHCLDIPTLLIQPGSQPAR